MWLIVFLTYIFSPVVFAAEDIKDFLGQKIQLTDVPFEKAKKLAQLYGTAFDTTDLSKGLCYSRATIVGTSLKRMEISSAKVFIQGLNYPITIKTGLIQYYDWHVANLIKSESSLYIIDPILSTEPLALEVWLRKFIKIRKFKMRQGVPIIKVRDSTRIDFTSEEQFSPPYGEYVDLYDSDYINRYCARNVEVCTILKL